MSIWLTIAIVSASPIPSTDIPAGTDLVLRVEVGKIVDELRSARESLSPLEEAHPPLAAVLARVDDLWNGPLARIARHLRADWRRPEVTTVVAVDLDAPGGVLWSAVIRGALAGKVEPLADAGVEEIEVDEHPAFRLAGAGVAWSVVRRGELVIGDERGLQRQLRQLLHPETTEQEIHREAARVRTRAPWVGAAVLPQTVRDEVEAAVPVVGPFLHEVAAGHFSADGKRVAVTLRAATAARRDDLLHGVRALLAALRATAANLEAGAEGMLGLHGLLGGPLGLPGIEPETLATLTRDWLTGFTLTANVRARGRDQAEVEIIPSGMRPLAATAGYALLRLIAGLDDAAAAESGGKSASRGAGEKASGKTASDKAAGKGGSDGHTGRGVAEKPVGKGMAEKPAGDAVAREPASRGRAEKSKAGADPGKPDSAGDEPEAEPKRGGGDGEMAPGIELHRL